VIGTDNQCLVARRTRRPDAVVNSVETQSHPEKVRPFIKFGYI